MSSLFCRVFFAILATCLADISNKGAGERDFLAKRPGLNQDVQLWNAFLRNEAQPDKGVGSDAQTDLELIDKDAQHTGIFLDEKVSQENEKTSDSRMQAALQSCLTQHFSQYLRNASLKESSFPFVVPRGSAAAVARAAVSSFDTKSTQDKDLIRSRLETCLESAEKGSQKGTTVRSAQPGWENPSIVASAHPPAWSSWGSKTRNVTPAKLAFISTNIPAPLPTIYHDRIDVDRRKKVSGHEGAPLKLQHLVPSRTVEATSNSCSVERKMCKKDQNNCRDVLDILHWLRVANIDVEQKMQAEADARKSSAPAPSELARSSKLLLTAMKSPNLRGQEKLLQTALDKVEAFEQRQKDQPYTHPLPTDVGASVTLVNHHTQPPQNSFAGFCQQQLDTCHTDLAKCKVDVDEHNKLLNKVAPRAVEERQARLDEYLHPLDEEDEKNERNEEP